MTKRVGVTGIGAISSMGIGCGQIWSSILNKRLNIVKEEYSIDGERWGEFYLHKMRNFNIEDFNLPAKNFGYIKGIRTTKKEDIDLYYFLAVVKLAIDDSKLQYDTTTNEIGLVITHENPGIEIFFEELVDSAYNFFEKNKRTKITKLRLAKDLYDQGCEDRGYNLQTFSYLFSVAKVFDIHGYSIFINNACASGLFAIEAAARQIKAGVSSAVIVAAVDNPTKIYKYLWFKKKGLYAEDGFARPFSNDSNGIVFGDGGAALVLEDMEYAKARGAKIYAEYLGGGFSLEGWKITVPDITSNFYERSFKKALDVSRVRNDEIDFVNPHGVGIKVTDTHEANIINRIFNKNKPLISAFKPLVGHNLGGSALLETAISLISMENEIIPATLNCENENKTLNLNIAKENVKKKINIIAKMSCGFAGFDGVVLFKKIRKDA